MHFWLQPTGSEADTFVDEGSDDEGSDDEDDQFYQSNTTDLACGRAGIGGGFESTRELKTLNYKEEMASENKIKWEQEIEIEN